MNIVGFDPDGLRVTLPPVPEWFEAELARIATVNGRPRFKLVDGSKETTFRNGIEDIKHLYGTETTPCKVPVTEVRYRRLNVLTGQFKVYKTLTDAELDDERGLSDSIDKGVKTWVKSIGWPCYVIETYIEPREICEVTWNEQRYAALEQNGIIQNIDVLGPFPREGRYVFCFPVLSKDGKAISPNQETLDECKRRYKYAQEPEKLEASIKAWHERSEALEARHTAVMADNLYQDMGITARRLYGGEISKPILTVKE